MDSETKDVVGLSSPASEWSPKTSKMIQSLKEIVNCSELEIYATLKDCNMDPNDTLLRLLSQDTFHEVKSEHEQRKEAHCENSTSELSDVIDSTVQHSTSSQVSSDATSNIHDTVEKQYQVSQQSHDDLNSQDVTNTLGTVYNSEISVAHNSFLDNPPGVEQSTVASGSSNLEWSSCSEADIYAKLSEFIATVSIKKESDVMTIVPAQKESDVMSIFPDEVLLEILRRLPNLRSVYRCMTVCKSWFSVIYANREYLESSLVHVLFSFPPHNREVQTFKELCTRPLLMLPKRVIPSIENCNLDFLPDWPDVSIRASFRDLVLVSYTLVRLFICNPRTRQWFAVPESPAIPKDYKLASHRGYGLVFGVKKKTCKVVIATLTGIYYSFYRISLSIYSSSTGQWSSSSVTCEFVPNTLSAVIRGQLCLDMVGTDCGILYCLGSTGKRQSKLKGVIEFNPFSFKLRFIKLPCHSWFYDHVFGPHPGTVSLGVVSGKLRISQIYKANQICYGLNIWELERVGSSEERRSWSLVHSVALRRVDSTVFLLALHPTDGDVIFVVCDGTVYQFDILVNVYENLGDFSGYDEANSLLKGKVASRMKVFPLVHTLWPTPIPIHSFQIRDPDSQ